MPTKSELGKTIKAAYAQFVEAESKLTEAQKTKRLAGLALGVAVYAAWKAHKTACDNKRKMKRCEKRLKKLEEKDFT